MPPAYVCPTPATPPAAGPAPAPAAGATPPPAVAGPPPTRPPASALPPARTTDSKSSQLVRALWLLSAHAAAQQRLRGRPLPPSCEPAHASTSEMEPKGEDQRARSSPSPPPGPRPDLPFDLEESNVNAAAILDPCPPSVAPPR
jgi:hypothetical protein